MTSYSINWFTLLLLCTSAPLVLCCDRFDHGSRQVKRELVDLVMEDYDVSLCQRMHAVVFLLSTEDIGIFSIVFVSPCMHWFSYYPLKMAMSWLAHALAYMLWYFYLSPEDSDNLASHFSRNGCLMNRIALKTFLNIYSNWFPRCINVVQLTNQRCFQKVTAHGVTLDDVLLWKSTVRLWCYNSFVYFLKSCCNDLC